jgi:sulfatase modifying factor 1
MMHVHDRRKMLGGWVTLVALLAAGAWAAAPVPAAAPPPGMALIPAGEFAMGSPAGSADNPVHPVKLKAFYLDTHEVTCAQYQAFCDATKRDLPMFWNFKDFRCGTEYPNHPVVGVSWRDAADYAAWCGKRLPTEAEWEYAARGGKAGLDFPNGSTLTPADANYGSSGKGGTLPVGSYAPNGYGLFDMLGNVAEWVSDRYDPDYYTTGPKENPPGPAKGKFRVFRGGGWHTGPGCCRIPYRNALPGNWLDFNVGFRCSKDAASPEGTGAPSK